MHKIESIGVKEFRKMNIYTRPQDLKFETSILSVEYLRSARRYGPPETAAHTSHGYRPFSPIGQAANRTDKNGDL